jgi:teichuronic acid biosynthesis glycosyltransferase TuaG
MSEQPLVSVITPAFNAAPFIGAAIESVLAQTRSDWEMIIVDDCSTDRTPSIIEEYGTRESRIRSIRLSSNQGQGPARNTALDAARGRYVAFLDADDLWDAVKLDRQLGFMQAHGHAFTYTAYRVISGSGEVLGAVRHLPQSMGYREMLCEQPGCLTVMLDRHLLGPLRFPSLRRNQDGALWLALLRGGGLRAYGLPEELASYRVVKSSATASKMKSARAVWEVLRGQEAMPLPAALWYFGQYAVRGLRKHLATRARDRARPR